MKTLSKMAVGEIDGAAQRKEWIRGGGLASVARWKPVNQESISNLEICLGGGRRGTNQRTDKGGGGKGCSLYEVERGRRAATTKEGRLHSRLLLQSWFAVSLEGQKYTSSSSLQEPYSNCWVHLVQGTSTGVIISIASSHAAPESYSIHPLNVIFRFIYPLHKVSLSWLSSFRPCPHAYLSHNWWCHACHPSLPSHTLSCRLMDAN